MLIPLVDAHVHLWDVERLSYPWLEHIPSLNQTHLLNRFDGDRDDVSIERIVFIECTGAMDDHVAQNEVTWIHSLAERDTRISAIVAHASLENGERAYAHLSWLAHQRLVRGIRRLIQGETDEAFCLSPGFIEGVQMLADFDFTFDACIFHHQLPSLIRLVGECPGIQFVLDHLGKPAIRQGLLDPWREHIRELAGLPNVVCKISGVLTEADHDNFTPGSVLPYLEYAIEQFGTDRIMFGSDWPVLRLAGTYAGWLELVLTVAQNMSEIDQRKLFKGNAERIYRLTK